MRSMSALIRDRTDAEFSPSTESTEEAASLLTCIAAGLDSKNQSGWLLSPGDEYVCE
jgi:hypothetical protein